MKYAIGPVRSVYLNNTRVYQLYMLLSEPGWGVLVQSEKELNAYREHLNTIIEKNNDMYPDGRKAVLNHESDLNNNWTICIGKQPVITIVVNPLTTEYVSDKALECIYKGGGTPTREEAMLLLTALSSSDATSIEKHLAADRLKELICILMPE